AASRMARFLLGRKPRSPFQYRSGRPQTQGVGGCIPRLAPAVGAGRLLRTFTLCLVLFCRTICRQKGGSRAMKTRFAGKILLVGCGYVGRCTLPLLLRHLDVPANRITVLDFVDARAAIADSLAKGVNYVIDRITPDNMAEVLSAHVGAGDMIIDLAWNIGCVDILQWCHDHGVTYLNTSVELWDPYADAANQHPTERTLYVRHQAVRERVASWLDPDGPTAVLEHGANPGLVSHFTKVAPRDVSRMILKHKPNDPRRAEL